MIRKIGVFHSTHLYHCSMVRIYNTSRLPLTKFVMVVPEFTAACSRRVCCSLRSTSNTALHRFPVWRKLLYRIEIYCRGQIPGLQTSSLAYVSNQIRFRKGEGNTARQSSRNAQLGRTCNADPEHVYVLESSCHHRTESEYPTGRRHHERLAMQSAVHLQEIPHSIRKLCTADPRSARYVYQVCTRN